MPHIAKIAVAAATYAIDRPYDYLVPEALLPTLKAGMRVAVPFGSGNRTCDGIVLSLSDTADATPKKLKSVVAQLDEEPMLDQEAIQLALWMREQYYCTVYDAARVILPAGLWFSLKDCWKIKPGIDREAAFLAAGRSRNAVRLLELLFSNQGWAELGQIHLAFGTADPGPAIRQLAEQGILEKETSAARGVGDKTESIASLAVLPEEAMALVAPRRRRAPLQYSVVETLCGVGTVSTKELCYFTGASMATLRALEKAGILTVEKRQIDRRPELPEVEPLAPPKLNQEQNAAYQGLLGLCQQGKPAVALLYGVTGSGKTQVYIRLIQSVLEQGKTAMILVPEIALTPQLMRIFTAHFGQQIAILHSSLSAGERYDEWKRIRRGEATVVIGTRSAVFAPLDRLGVIILDEEQEYTYKSEQTPRYHARDVAKYRCWKSNALLVLGSATPSVETMYCARRGDYHLFTLPHRFNERAMPQVSIIDMKQELRNGRGGSISQALEEQLQGVIQRGEQAILFINRRGANRMVVCGECGAVPSCPRCSVHLTYHSANHRLMCHHCGHSEPLPAQCPECGGLYSHVGAGTQQVETDLRRLFPDVPILRMDTDTVTATRSHEAILEQFRKEKIPILLGTQMVAKGLDFENVTLVGIVDADQMLYMEDFRAGERTFSLLTQVAGRSGRGGKEGHALLQTYTPENEVIQCAARQDYDAFYEQEIRLRQLQGYPPFGDLIVLNASGPEETAVLCAAIRLRDSLLAALERPDYQQCPYQLLGPAPAAIVRVNNRYRYRLTLKTNNTKMIRQLIAYLIRKAQSDKLNRGVSVFADLNPIGS